MKDPAKRKSRQAAAIGDFDKKLSRLMLTARNGDSGAYGNFIRALTPYLRSKARRMGACACDVDDVVQDVLLSLHLNKVAWEPAVAMSSWLSTIVRNKVIDRYRKRLRSAEVLLDDFENLLAANEADPVDASTTRFLLRTLDVRSRAIVEYIYIDGSSAREVAGRLGMTEGAVRVAHHRALKTLAQAASHHLH